MYAKRVKFGFSGKVGGVGGFGTVKETEPKAFSRKFYLSNPFAVLFAPARPKKSASVVLVRAFSIMNIFRPSRFTKIGYGVVRSDSISMVDLTGREYAMNVQPRQPMSKVSPLVNQNPDVSVFPNVSSYASGVSSASGIGACKNPGLLEIVKNFAQSFNRNICRIFTSHDVTLSQIGKRRGRVDSACLASSLYHVKNALLRLEALEVTGA